MTQDEDPKDVALLGAGFQGRFAPGSLVIFSWISTVPISITALARSIWRNYMAAYTRNIGRNIELRPKTTYTSAKKLEHGCRMGYAVCPALVRDCLRPCRTGQKPWLYRG